MKYFIDTEFVEGCQKSLFRKCKPTIDLISIGIVNEKGDTYYAISKDFNVKEAWNRYDIDEYGKKWCNCVTPKLVSANDGVHQAYCLLCKCYWYN